MNDQQENINVIIVHRNMKEYLKNNLEITGKNNKIILVGDKSVEHLGNMNNVTFINMEKYINHEYIVNLKKQFINYANPKREDYQWFCFCRVFIIKLVMEELNLSKIFHIDSDNILLKNINKYNFTEKIAYVISKDINKHNMCASIHCGLLNMNFCNKFEELYNDIYINKTKFNLIEDKIDSHRDKNGNYSRGGICDMTLYYLLQKLEIIKVQNLEKYVILDGQETTFMNVIRGSDGPDGKGQYKMNKVENLNVIDITKSENGKHNLIYDKINNKYIDVFNIHFQANSKNLLNKDFINKINI